MIFLKEKIKKKELQKLVENSFLGLAMGDALGVPVEFKSREYLKANPVKTMIGHGSHDQEKGTFSDDTSMTLATAVGLTKGKDIVSQIAEEFKEWFFKGKYAVNKNLFDVGITTQKAIVHYPHNNNFTSNYKNNGNGSLMRIIPLAFYMYNKKEYNTIEERKKLVYAVSSITHSHIISKICCVIYVEIALEIISRKLSKTFKFGDLLDVMQEKIAEVYNSYSLDTEAEMHISEFNNIFHYNIFTCTRDEVKSTGYVIDTLESVLWCIANTKSYSEAVMTAVNLGGDTDTIGSLVGGLAGIVYGDLNSNSYEINFEGQDEIAGKGEALSKSNLYNSLVNYREEDWLDTYWIEDLKEKSMILKIAKKFSKVCG